MKSNHIFQTLLVSVLSFQLASCGTILYPERKGQKAGHLDVGVVVLDAIGLLFFLIPGIIAFAVDFSNGTIYLPATAKGSGKDSNYRVVYFDPTDYTQESLEKIISNETGSDFHFDDENLEHIRLKNEDEISLHLNKFTTSPSTQLNFAGLK